MTTEPDDEPWPETGHDDPSEPLHDPAEDGPAGYRARVKKAPTAFRTISEVADDLHIPQHVLRFWEQRFPQVRPLKRGGGRRYYRPEDVELLRRISSLLYVQGYTIKGVQRLLREGAPLDGPGLPPPGAAEADEPDELPFDPPPQRVLEIPARPVGPPVPLPRPAAARPEAGPVDRAALRELLDSLLSLRASLRG
ncbi:DNA-binding transcriptional MerR regulator [Endobacter medicaginis]|uniref:DNA-binding transcriptional MerR regulator n=3 Tax=Endobacter medicaginis TaxID=1181271 RepID=A0A839UUI6_9PROT|nr:MerR family transcriptional regulator [Endobacter medicaginis]MBB3173457.1 DNA-binding transcriptional MerR regulator [Endobacter medicaginis]